MKIAIVYFRDPRGPRDGMDLIRWRELARELWQLGHEVDMVSPAAPTTVIAQGFGIRNLSEVVDWDAYDVVKTRSHKDILSVPEHRFIVSRIGRVVDAHQPSHQWALREERIQCQRLVHARSRAVIFTCPEAIPRWQDLYPDGPSCFVLPTGCPTFTPEPSKNPYTTERNVVFVGSLTSSRFVERLNALGRALKARSVHLYFLGRNQLDLYRETDEDLDPFFVTTLGCVEESRTWDYLYHADVGVTFARSADVADSDSSKLYYYLRAGLPTVSEEHVASNYLIHETGFGSVARYNDIGDMADRALEWIGRREGSVSVQDFMIRNHSWECRARLLEAYLRRGLQH